MSKAVRLDPAAEAELAQAEAWYDEHAGLGSELVSAVREAGGRIAEKPQSFPFARNVPRTMAIRVLQMQRFPYSLFFIELEDEIRILAVAHHRRRPYYWRKRVGRKP